MMPKRQTEELLTPTASDRGTRSRLTKTKDAEKIIINRQGRSTYPEEKSVLTSGATPHFLEQLQRIKCVAHLTQLYLGSF